MKNAPLYIASDHGGYQLKRRLVRYITNELNLEIEDMGPFEYVEDDDYPDYVIPLAKRVAKTKNARGIVICKNGIGVCVAANKTKGVRAGIGYSLMAAQTMVEDDNTNILCLAAKGVTQGHAMKIVKRWLNTEFSKAPRHKRRLKKVAKLEK